MQKNKKYNRKKRYFIKNCIKFLIKWGFIISIWCLIILAIIFAYCSKDLPDVISHINNQKDINIKILYSNNEEIKSYGELNSNVMNYAEFPFHLIDALIATEDRKFFKHNGFDYFGILRAMATNVRAGYTKQGGSTITQQLSKMILKNSKKTIKRKIQELLLSIQLEKKFTKEEILTMYLNKAYFGAGKYGIQDASKFYFNKDVSKLNLEESAMLVGLLKAPTKYSPQNNLELSNKRTKQIITNMYNAKLLSKDLYNQYINNYNNTISINNNYNEKLNEELYFSEWIKGQIQDYTNETNIEVKTTLNKKIQKAIELGVIDFNNEYKNKLKNSQIAVIVLSNDGAILGMTGGINYNKSEFNRAIYAYRQPGSSFKIFVFLAGIREKGFTPETRFIDEPVAVGNWFPENHGKKYYGKVSMKTAFAKSLNSVAVQISEYSRLKNVAKLAKKMGIISKIDIDDPTIALGTTQVNLLELTSAYAVINNGGNAVIPYSILEIKDKNNNNIVYKRKTAGLSKILNEYEVKYMKEMMYEVVVNGTGKKAGIDYLIDRGEDYIGGKTGTSQNYSDAWFIGYTNDMIVGVWVGNDDNTSMGDTTGGSLPSILWKKIVQYSINN